MVAKISGLKIQILFYFYRFTHFWVLPVPLPLAQIRSTSLKIRVVRLPIDPIGQSQFNQ
jgi:hypothetical protein